MKEDGPQFELLGIAAAYVVEAQLEAQILASLIEDPCHHLVEVVAELSDTFQTRSSSILKQ